MENSVNELAFEMTSNSGSKLVEILSSPNSRTGVILANVRITTQDFALSPETGKIASTNLVELCQITLSRVPIRVAALAQLQSVLRECADVILDDPHEVELSEAFGPIVATISNPDESWAERRKPVFRLRFHIPSVKCEVAYIIDQTCLRLAEETLSEWLAAYDRAR